MEQKVGGTRGPSRAANTMAVAVALAIGHSAPSLAAGDAAHGATVYHQ